MGRIVQIYAFPDGSISRVVEADNDNLQLPKSWSEARESGSSFYFTGVACKFGHVTSRRFVTRCCIECEREKAKIAARKKREKDPEAVNAYKRELRSKNPKVRETEAAYLAAHPEQTKAKRKRDREKRDPERMAAHRKKWAEANPEKAKESHKKWAAANPEIVLAISRNRYARKKGNGGTHTAEDILTLLKKQKYKCTECGISVKEKRHVDHIMPLRLGGPNDKSNLQILCPNCNQRKNGLHPADWARKQGRLI